MRIAVIGLGMMGKRHIQALRLVPGCQLVAGADQRPEAQTGMDGLVEKLYTDWQTALDETRPEMVVIATHAPSHEEITLAAAALGAKIILCEKPMATSLRAARRMMTACQQAGTLLLINHTRRGVGIYQRLATLIQGPVMGGMASAFWAIAGGRLGCNGPHFFDIMAYLAGAKIKSVRAALTKNPPANPRGAQFFDPGGQVVAELADGSRLVVDMVEDLAGPNLGLIMCRKGRILIEETTGRLEVTARDPDFIPQPGKFPGFVPVSFNWPANEKVDLVQWMKQVYEEISAGRTANLEAENGYESLEVYMGCVFSNEQGGAPISLPITDIEKLEREVAIT